MFKYNALIDSDSIESKNYEAVLLRLSQDESITLLLQKFKSSNSYAIELNFESSLESLRDRGVSFNASESGFTINLKEKSDIELVSAALHSVGEMMEMLQEGHVPESIPTHVIGHPNKVDNIFDPTGEPYKEKKLFDSEWEIIKPANKEDVFVPPLQTIGSNRQREFNHLRVRNLQYFFANYANNTEPYTSPFEVLAELESRVKFEDFPEASIFITYKDGGDLIFTLKGMHHNGNVRIVEYEYEGGIS